MWRENRGWSQLKSSLNKTVDRYVKQEERGEKINDIVSIVKT